MPPPQETWLEQNALLVVGVFVGTVGALWLCFEEWRHRRSLEKKLTGAGKPSLQAPLRPAAGKVAVVRTAQKSEERLSTLPDLKLAPASRNFPGGLPMVVVDPGVTYQHLIGFGGSFTETAADLVVALSADRQSELVDAYFSADTGLGYRVGRLHMNSCDFSAGNWTCTKPGDKALSSFSVDRYHKSIFPLMKRAAEKADGPVSLLASPWSPPAWMKDSGRMLSGGKLRPDWRESWANHYVKFARELEAAGLPLWAFSVQNEPNATTMWENCLYDACDERDFVRDHLGPALEGSGMDVKLLVWDHNREDMLHRARTIYADQKAAKHVWGCAFHWYGDPRYEGWPDKAGMVCYDNCQAVHDLRPEKHLVMSEGCQEGGPHLGDWKLGERYAENIIKDLNHWTEAWIDWNLCLNMKGGPNHVGNNCSAPVLVDVERDALVYQSSYFYMGHFSRYIRPGARRVLCSASRDALECTAFANTDGTIAVVVLNQRDAGVAYALECLGQCATTEAPAHSISTLVFLNPSVEK